MNFRYLILLYPLFVCFGLRAQEIYIKKLDFNSKINDEFAPNYYKDGILFVSNKKNNVIKTIVEVDENGKETYLDKLYYAKHKNKDSTKFNVVPLQIAEIEKKEGPAVYSKTDDCIIFTQSLPEVSRKEKEKLALFQTERINEHWTTPKILPFVNLSYNYSHPCLSEDGNRLLFVSDMVGGKGNMDIWESKKENNIWQEPINLGTKINSTENDIFPSFGKDNTIYFSSKRTEGYGEYDIYLSDSLLDNLILMPKPINSVANDFSYISKDNHTGYFSSDRSGSDDIYIFSKNFIFPDSCIESYKPKMCFTFFDISPLSDSISYYYKWYFGDGSVGYKNYANHCFANEGEYEVVLSLIDSLSGYEIKKVANYPIKIKKYLPNYISITEEKEIFHLVLKDSKTENSIKKPMVWQINQETVLLNKEKVYLSNNELSLGYHTVKLTALDDSNTCYKDVFFNNYSLEQKECKIKLIPNVLKMDTYIGEELAEYISKKMAKIEIKKAIIIQPSNMIPSDLSWLEKFKNQFYLEYGLTISNVIDPNSSDLYLILQ